MAGIDVESVLHEALTDAAIGQPDAPADRLSGVRRHHQRRRMAQGIAAAVAVAAVVGTVVGVGLPGSRQTPPAHRPVPSWALPWPDHRDGSVPQSVLNGAVTAWRHFDTPGRPHRILWYVGQQAVEGSWVVAIFEAETDTGRHLVVAQAQAADVMHGEPAFSANGGPWVIRDVPAPDPARPPALVGLNLGDVNSPGITNWIVVLTRPNETGFHWQAPGSAGGTARLSQGLAVVDTGHVRGQVSVILNRPAGEVGPVNPLPVAVPGDEQSGAPQLESARKVDIRGHHLIAELGGQSAGADSFGLGHSHARITIVARCYGRGPVHLTLDDGPFAVNVPCDDQQHEFAGPRLSPHRGGHTIFVNASDYTAYDFAIVTN